MKWLIVWQDLDLKSKALLKWIRGVITVVESMGQIQVVIGNKVKKVYDEVIKIVPQSNNIGKKNESQEKQGIINSILSAVAGIFTPTIPAIAGVGMI